MCEYLCTGTKSRNQLQGLNFYLELTDLARLTRQQAPAVLVCLSLRSAVISVCHYTEIVVVVAVVAAITSWVLRVQLGSSLLEKQTFAICTISPAHTTLIFHKGLEVLAGLYIHSLQESQHL